MEGDHSLIANHKVLVFDRCIPCSDTTAKARMREVARDQIHYEAPKIIGEGCQPATCLHAVVSKGARDFSFAKCRLK